MAITTKKYLDKDGVAKVLLKLQEKILAKISNEIEMVEQIDIETGEVTKVLKYPNRLPTNKAVADFVGAKEYLKINLKSTEDSGSEYNVKDNITEYNGNQEVLIDLDLISNGDIRSLFFPGDSSLNPLDNG